MDDNVLDGVKAFLNNQERSLEDLAHVSWLQYNAFLKEGFTEQQAFELTETILTTMFGG